MFISCTATGPQGTDVFQSQEPFTRKEAKQELARRSTSGAWHTEGARLRAHHQSRKATSGSTMNHLLHTAECLQPSLPKLTLQTSMTEQQHQLVA